jgi:hypothetical protein
MSRVAGYFPAPAELQKAVSWNPKCNTCTKLDPKPLENLAVRELALELAACDRECCVDMPIHQEITLQSSDAILRPVAIQLPKLRHTTA